jgi:hypothetical protein
MVILVTPRGHRLHAPSSRGGTPSMISSEEEKEANRGKRDEPRRADMPPTTAPEESEAQREAGGNAGRQGEGARWSPRTQERFFIGRKWRESHRQEAGDHYSAHSTSLAWCLDCFACITIASFSSRLHGHCFDCVASMGWAERGRTKGQAGNRSCGDGRRCTERLQMTAAAGDCPPCLPAQLTAVRACRKERCTKLGCARHLSSGVCLIVSCSAQHSHSSSTSRDHAIAPASGITVGNQGPSVCISAHR